MTGVHTCPLAGSYKYIYHVPLTLRLVFEFSFWCGVQWLYWRVGFRLVKRMVVTRNLKPITKIIEGVQVQSFELKNPEIMACSEGCGFVLPSIQENLTSPDFSCVP